MKEFWVFLIVVLSVERCGANMHHWPSGLTSTSAPLKHAKNQLFSFAYDVTEKITHNKVFIFSKQSCPYCTEVKNLFRKHSIDFKKLEMDTIELNGEPVGHKFHEKVIKYTKDGETTVP